MDAVEMESSSALAEESLRTNELLGQLFDEAARDPTTIFRHNPGCLAQPGAQCNCTFARMNLNDMSALDAAAQTGLVGLTTQPKIPVRISAQENQFLSNVALFFGIVTAEKTGNPSRPKPLSALRMRTTGDEGGRCFLGPNGS